MPLQQSHRRLILAALAGLAVCLTAAGLMSTQHASAADAEHDDRLHDVMHELEEHFRELKRTVRDETRHEATLETLVAMQQLTWAVAAAV